MSLMRREPSFFCCSSRASICSTDNRPSSTSASAMPSPNDLTLAMILAEGFAEVKDQVGGRRQIPQQPVLGRSRQILHRLLVEGIGGGHEDGFAHAVEGQDAPAAGKHPREKAPQKKY